MTGLEKIIEKIHSDSVANCNAVITGAEKSAQAERADVVAAAKVKAQQIIDRANQEAQAVSAAANSSASQQSRQILLSAKVNAVNKTLGKIIDKMLALDKSVYFDRVLSFAKDGAIKGNCTAFFNRTDLDRMDDGFKAEFVRALSEKGAVCTFSSEPGTMKGGCVLDYGHIAVDCSFESLIEENSDLLKEKISEILFADGR
ncbi:MAG: V-type ATP synthase subunit E [Clostridiales bacterium]|nr:V-type ATP synthase subunit E [Clostridiales bacterium]